MDIAWRAEAHAVGGEGVVYVAVAPLAQQLAAAELLSKGPIALLEGSGVIENALGQCTPMSFISIRERIFDCYEVQSPPAQPNLRHVILTCGFDADASAAFMRRMAELAHIIPTGHPDKEGGFVGAYGLSDGEERVLFEQLPREPMPASEFFAAITRAASELNAT